MNIKLSNFRQHEFLEVNLPDTGLVRIAGNSGAGKTTVFDAIEEAFFGTQKNLKPWQGGSPHVHFTIGDIEVERTYTPNKVALQLKGVQYEDDEAQKQIEEKLAMNYDEFMACSYIRQGFSNSLLDKTPEGMMRFVQSLLKHKTDPEKLKKGVQTEIKESEKAIEKQKGSCDSIKQNLEKLKNKNMQNPGQKPAPEEYGLTENEVYASLFSSQKKDLEAEKQTLQNQLQSQKNLKEDIEDLTKKKNQEDTKRQQIQERIRENNYSENDTTAADGFAQKMEYFEAEIKKYQSFANAVTEKQKLQNLVFDVYSMYPESQECGKPLKDFLQEKKTELQNSKEEVVAKMSQAEKQYEENQELLRKYEKTGKIKTYPCPHCETELVFNKAAGNLAVFDKGGVHDIDKEIQKCQEEQQRISMNVTDLNTNKQELTNSIEKVEDILQKGQEYRKKHQEKLQEVPRELAKQIHEYNHAKIDEKVQKIIKERQEFRDKQSEIQQLFKDLHACDNRNTFLENDLSEKQSKALSDTEIADLERRIQQCIQKIRQTEEKIEKVQDYKYAVRMHEDKQVLYDEYQTELENAKTELQEQENELQKRINQHAAAVRLKEIIEHSEAESIEMIIAAINFATKGYIERMFGDDGTEVRLNNFSITNKGDERAKIGLEIYHKGQKLKNTKSLSGGEKSRLSLCFQLGLSKMYNSPLLMVDEGFTGLHPDLKEDCIEVLQSEAHDKLILVVEHGASDRFFDKVVSV